MALVDKMISFSSSTVLVIALFHDIHISGQLLNAAYWIVETLSGIVTSVSDEQSLNAYADIAGAFLDHTADCKEAHPSHTLSPTKVTLLGIVRA